MEPLAGERTQGIRRPRRPIAVALAVVSLLALVALASRGHRPGGGGGSTRHVNGDLILEYVVLFMLAAGIVVVPLVAQAFWTRRHWYARRRQAQSWPKRMFASLVILTAILAGFYIWRVVTDGGPNSRAGRPRIGLPPSAGGQESRNAGPQFDWLPVVVVGLLLLAGVAIVAVAILRERQALRRAPQTLAEQLSDVLDDTLDDLRAEPDARRAVIAAYARMERALAWFGLPRKAFEAPLEYLRRVLVDLHASAESVRRLTGLFERAKFSPHEIGPSLKTDAIEALVTVRDELRAYR